MKLKTLAITAQWLFILCLPVLLLTAAIALAVNSLWLYKHGFEKYDVSQTTGLEKAELEKAARGLISYFNSGEVNISLSVVKNGEPLELFNQREVSHLRDVKGLVWLDYWVFLGTLIYVLGYAATRLFWKKNRRRLAWGVAGGSSLTLVLMLALGLGTLLGFDQLFLQFHLLSFANDLWQLDPTRDYLVMLFPRGFWYDATLFCALATVAMAIILGGAAGGYLWISRRRSKS